MADDSGSFEVNGKRYSLPTDLTLGEMADAERYFGVEFGVDMSTSSMRMVAALMWVAIRREDSTVTVDDIRNLPASVFESFSEAADANPPELEKSAASEPSGKASNGTGDALDADLTSIGSHGWPTGSDSDLLTSKT